jgi:hypothetical protein
LLPFGAHANAAPAIVIEGLIVRIGTSVPHAAPNSVQAGPTIAVCLFLDEPVIRSPAPAGFRMADPKKFSDDNGFLPAGASAAPQGMIAPAAGTFNRGQSTKRLASDINEGGHLKPRDRLWVASDGLAVARRPVASL